MFINNNHASFHFWWKENSVMYQKISKYYIHDCLQNFVLLLVPLLTALVLKSYISKQSYFALIMSWNCAKSLILTKIVKKTKFEGVWNELEAKNVSRDNHGQNI